ncbi:MAG: hypothetical protein RIQ41_125 [Candidatus Parcubacteria bacterium]|jgi:hypothetical protein
MEQIKTYKAILVAVFGLVLVVGGAYMYMDYKPVTKEPVIKKTSSKTLEGKVIRTFEGDNTIEYSLTIPEDATTTVGMEGALVKIATPDAPYISMYFSYEGGRGYMPSDYIKNVIVPRVSALTMTGTTTVGGTIWTVAESEQSEWHVAQVGDGQWLLVTENKKSLHDAVLETLESLITK